MRFRSFTDWEEMQEALAVAVEAANTRVQPWQRQLSVGNYFLSYSEDASLFIFGEVLDPLDSSDPEEREFQRQTWSQPHMAGYRFTKCYSEVVPEGEYGDTHISTVLKILPEADFLKFKEANWPNDLNSILKVLND